MEEGVGGAANNHDRRVVAVRTTSGARISAIAPTFKEAAAMLKVSCPQAELHSRVQTVSHGVTGRSTQPVQNNLYLMAGVVILDLLMLGNSLNILFK